MSNTSREIQDELLEIAPALARFRQRNAPVNFSMPPQYFNCLADQVLAKIAVNAEPSAFKTQPHTWWRLGAQGSKFKAISIAATFLIAAFAFWLVPKTLNNFKSPVALANTEVTFTPLDEADIQTLIQESKTDIDADFLTNNLGVTEKELSLNMPENSDENMNTAIDKYIKESDTTNNL